MGMITHNLGLCFNDKFVRLYGRRTGICRAIYNWGVCECTEDDCRAYIQGDEKPHMDEVNHKLAKQEAKQAGAGDILNSLVFRRDDLCTVGREGMYVRSEFPSLGCPQTTRQLVRTVYNDWIKLFIVAAHNGINKQKPTTTHSFFSEVQYDQT